MNVPGPWAGVTRTTAAGYVATDVYWRPDLRTGDTLSGPAIGHTRYEADRLRVRVWFELDDDSPYMLLVADVTGHRRRLMNEDEQALFGIDQLNVPRSDIPAITHVDYSARVQTVSRDVNPDYYDLIKEFESQTGCAVVVNTSFNVRGEPIVCTPKDAIDAFHSTPLDALVIGSFVLRKPHVARAATA